MLSVKTIIKTIDIIDGLPDNPDKRDLLNQYIRELSSRPMGEDGHNIINWFNIRFPELKKKYEEFL